jgi:hypothetical protein
VIVNAYSNTWPVLFPQHGAGRKHLRPIVLEAWQRRIVERHPIEFVRGCIESDGCRHRRTVAGRGVRPRRASRVVVSIARRADVAKLASMFSGSHADNI